eukprot:1177713-Prorocentrum_minimum.AAC.3
MHFMRSALFDHTTAICPFTSCPKSNLDKTPQHKTEWQYETSKEYDERRTQDQQLIRLETRTWIGTHQPEIAETARCSASSRQHPHVDPGGNSPC